MEVISSPAPANLIKSTKTKSDGSNGGSHGNDHGGHGHNHANCITGCAATYRQARQQRLASRGNIFENTGLEPINEKEEVGKVGKVGKIASAWGAGGGKAEPLGKMKDEGATNKVKNMGRRFSLQPQSSGRSSIIIRMYSPA